MKARCFLAIIFGRTSTRLLFSTPNEIMDIAATATYIIKALRGLSEAKI